MKKKQKKLILIFSITLIVVLILGGYYPLNKITAKVILEEDRIDAFSKCLTENNVKFYGSMKDSSSLAQKKMFGKSFDNLIYIDCLDRKDECTEILIFPSWGINDKIFHGGFSLEALSKLTGCEL